MLMTEFAQMVSNMLKLSHISSSESVTNIDVTFQSIWARFDCLYLTGQRNRDAKRKFFKGLFQIGMQATLGGYNNEACPHLQLIWLIFDPWIDFWIYKWMICKQMTHSPASNSPFVGSGVYRAAQRCYVPCKWRIKDDFIIWNHF